MSITIKEVFVHYNEGEALKGISINVMEGSIVTLIGSNGAGKTTTLRAISGLVPISSGEIYFRDKRINGLPHHKIVDLGIAHVPEGRGIFPNMSVLENIKIGAFLRRDQQEVKKDLQNVFEYFPKLKERIKQQAGSLSGGEQQMLAIARGLMNHPSILMMDEPSLGLAPIMIENVTKIILAIHKATKLTIIIVEQNAQMALELADSGYVMETGRVVLQGSCKELQNDEGVRNAYLGI
jgi:branched-chain amino acid transport system ATP-binding protein